MCQLLRNTFNRHAVAAQQMASLRTMLEPSP
jgi:hypothetical protein